MFNMKRSLDLSIEWLIYILVVFVPLIYLPFAEDYFSFPKAFFIGAVTLVLFAVICFRIICIDGIKISKTPIYLPILLWALWVTISSIYADNHLSALYGEIKRCEGLLSNLAYLFLFFISLNYMNKEEKIEKSINFSILAALSVSILGLMQYVGFIILAKDPGSLGYDRIFSTLRHANFLAAYLLTVFPLVWKKYFSAQHWNKRIIMLVIHSLMFLCLIYTYCRGSWIGFGLAFLFFVLFLGNPKARRGQILVLIVSMGLSIFVSSFVSQGFQPHSSFKVTQRAISTFQVNEGSAQTRIYLWRDTINMIKDNLFLGVGLNNYKEAFTSYRKEALKLETEEGAYDKAHNDFLHIWATQGLIGLCIFLFLLFRIFKTLFTAAKEERDNKRRDFYGAVLAILIGYLGQIFFGFSTITTSLQLWVFMGLGIGSIYTKEMLQEKIEFRIKLPRTTIIIPLVLSSFGLFLLGKAFLSGYYFDKGNYEVLSGNNDRAIIQYKKAVDLTSGREDVYRSTLASTLKQKALASGEKQKNKLLSAAIANLEAAVKVNHHWVNYYTQLGYLYWLNGESDKAISAYENAVELAPYFKMPRQNLALLYENQKNIESALKQWAILLDNYPDNYLYYLKVSGGLIALHNPKLAIPYLNGALKLKPNSIAARMNLGFAYLQLNKFDLAINEFKKVLQIDPSNTDAALKLEICNKKLSIHESQAK